MFMLSKDITKLIIAVATSLVTPMALAQTATDAGSAPQAAPVKKAKPSTKVPAKKPVKVTEAAEAPAAPATEPAAPEANGDKLLLKFDTNSAPTTTDVREPLKFKVPGTGEKPSEEQNTLSEDAPFKTFVGYPKHSLSAFVEPMNLAATWKYNGASSDWSDSPIGYGIGYKFAASPLLTFDAELMTFSDSTASGLVPPTRIDASSYTYKTFFVGGNYCFVSDSNFFKRLCPGAVIGRDEYPILNFGSGNTVDLTLNTVADFTLGINLKYEYPFRDNLLFGLVGGYNMGTGVGNSGNLTSTDNSSYYIKAKTDWTIRGPHTANIQLDYLQRNAKLEGKTNATTTAKWETDSAILGGRLGYTYTF